MRLPPFNSDGLLPPGDYEMTLEELEGSMLVVGPGRGAYPDWDAVWRGFLVGRLGVLVGQLWEVGITEIFVGGSFVEDKDHPEDIDGYFECSFMDFATGRLQGELNALDPYTVWTWDPKSRRPYRNHPKPADVAQVQGRALPLPSGPAPRMWDSGPIRSSPHFPGRNQAV